MGESPKNSKVPASFDNTCNLKQHGYTTHHSIEKKYPSLNHIRPLYAALLIIMLQQELVINESLWYLTHPLYFIVISVTYYSALNQYLMVEYMSGQNFLHSKIVPVTSKVYPARHVRAEERHFLCPYRGHRVRNQLHFMVNYYLLNLMRKK